MLVCLGADQRQQAALQRALVQLNVVADLEAADHVEQRLQRHALGVEQQLLARGPSSALVIAGADVEDAQVAEHLALVRQEGRVAPFARVAGLEVVGHLAVQELFASAPVSASLPRSERSTSPQRSVSAAYSVSRRAVSSDEIVCAAIELRG